MSETPQAPVPTADSSPVDVSAANTAAAAAAAAAAGIDSSSTVVNNQHWQQQLLLHLKQHIHKLQQQQSDSAQPLPADSQLTPDGEPNLAAPSPRAADLAVDTPLTAVPIQISSDNIPISSAPSHTNSNGSSSSSSNHPSESPASSSNPPSFYFLPDSTPSYMSPVPPLSIYTISTPRSSFSYPPTEAELSAASAGDSNSGSSSSSAKVEDGAAVPPNTMPQTSIPLSFPMLVYTTGETQIDTKVGGSIHRTKYCWVQVSDYGVMYCDGRLLCTLPHLQHHNQQIQSAHMKLMDQHDSPCRVKGSCEGHPYVHLTSQLTTKQWVEILPLNPSSGSSSSETVSHSGDRDRDGKENQGSSGSSTADWNGSIGIGQYESGSSSCSGSSMSGGSSSSRSSRGSSRGSSMDVNWNFEPDSPTPSTSASASSSNSSVLDEFSSVNEMEDVEMT